MVLLSKIFIFLFVIQSPIAIQFTTDLFQQNPFIAKLELNETEGKLNIVGKFENNSTDSIFIRYEMKANKIGKSGKSISTQSGNYISEPNIELVLAKVGLNIDNETKYEIILEVFKEEELISADSLNYIPENH
jgi:hypothetical protein